MQRVSRTVWLVLVVVGILLGLGVARRPAGPSAPAGGYVDGAMYRLTPAEADAAHTEVLPRPRPLRFDPTVSPEHRRLVLAAIASARPEARRLVDRVAGLAVTHVGTLPGGEVGLTQLRSDGSLTMTLDVDLAYRIHGQRGVNRLVLHELGHVVDIALVPNELERSIDATTPTGYGCDEGHSGGCAPMPERFAESFAKWATGDIGLDIYEGYKVPPPDLETWGRPLEALAR